MDILCADRKTVLHIRVFSKSHQCNTGIHAASFHACELHALFTTISFLYVKKLSFMLLDWIPFCNFPVVLPNVLPEPHVSLAVGCVGCFASVPSSIRHRHHILPEALPRPEVPFRECSKHSYRKSSFHKQSVPRACIQSTACAAPSRSQDLQDVPALH